MVQTEASSEGASFSLPSTLGTEIGACGDSVAVQSTAWGANPHECLGGSIAEDENDGGVSSLSLSCDDGSTIAVANLSLGQIGLSLPSASAAEAVSRAEASGMQFVLNCSKPISGGPRNSSSIIYQTAASRASFWCTTSASWYDVDCDEAPGASAVVFECPNASLIVECKFWDATMSAWSTEGQRFVLTTKERPYCDLRVTHLS